MVEKNEAPNETEPVELVEPEVVDAVVVDDEAVHNAAAESAAAEDAATQHDPSALETEAAGTAGTGELLIEDLVAESPAADVTSVDATPAPVREVQTVYITAPVPPKKRGNRGMGSLLTIAAALVFAVVYFGVAALLLFIARPESAATAVVAFATSSVFYVPVLVFLVIMLLWVFIVNRAAWSAWVFGSLVIAVVVYAASIGVLLLLAGGFGLTATAASEVTARLAIHPALIAAGLIAREVSIWFGAAIAARGRKVRERNVAAWEEFEREEAEKRAGLGGTVTA